MLASLLYYAPVLIGCAAVWIAADVWERMEKRTTRANESPATKSPVASEAATEGNVKLVLIRGNKRCAIGAIQPARTTATRITHAPRTLRRSRNSDSVA